MDERSALVRAAYRPGRDTLITTASFLAVSLAGAASSLLLVLVAGGGEDVDGVVAAYSVFLVVSLFAATTRPILLPLMGTTTPEGAFRARAADLAGRTALVGVLAAMGLAAISPAMVVAFSGTVDPSGRRELAGTLLILAPAAWLQIRTAAASAVLAAANRFTTSALIYAVSATVTVAATAVGLLVSGAFGLAIGALLGSVALAVGHQIILTRHEVRVAERPARLRQRNQWTLTGTLLVSSAVPLSWHLQLVISLALVSGATGEVTAYAYAYYLAFAVLGLAGSASIVTLPRLVERLREAPDRPREVAGYVASVSAPVMLGVGSVMAAAAAFGDPVASWVLDGSLGAPATDTLVQAVAALGPLAVAIAALLILWPTAGSLGRQGPLALVAVGATGLCLALDLLVRGDTLAVALVQSACAVAMLLVGVVVVTGRAAPRLFTRLAAGSVPLAAAAGWITLVRLVLGDGGSPAGALGLALGTLGSFLVVGALVWPSTFTPLPLLGRLAARSPRAA